MAAVDHTSCHQKSAGSYECVLAAPRTVDQENEAYFRSQI